MDALLYAILGSLLHNRFVSPLWIPQTDSLSSKGFGREMAAQKQKPVSGPDPDFPKGIQFSIVNSTLLWRKRCSSIMFLGSPPFPKVTISPRSRYDLPPCVSGAGANISS